MKIARTAILFLLVLVLAACRTATVYNVDEADVVTDETMITLEDVESAIKRAGVGLGWAMKSVRPGLIEGTLLLRSHMAKVEIPYSIDSYSILYKDSNNLKYDGTTIHSNYNGWIQNLDNAIRSQLMAL